MFNLVLFLNVKYYTQHIKYKMLISFMHNKAYHSI